MMDRRRLLHHRKNSYLSQLIHSNSSSSMYLPAHLQPHSSSISEFINLLSLNYTTSMRFIASRSLKSDTKSIKILNSEHHPHSTTAALNYEYARYAAKATTTSAPEPIAISSDQPSRHPIEYELEEQLIYELQPLTANKSADDERSHPIHHDGDDDEFKSVSTAERIKPHVNLSPVPNGLTDDNDEKGRIKVNVNDAENDYYDSDYDGNKIFIF
jgi:hypothetical protein